MIQTNRLIIKPLSCTELIIHIKSPMEFAQEMGLKPSVSLVKKETQDAILNDLLPNISDESKNYIFYTMWIIIEKNFKAIIGGICFHGEPDQSGEVEIGYGIDEEYRNKGYMTETISGLINWAKDNRIIKLIRAETEKSNIQSISVLEKNNFKSIEQLENSVIMKLDLRKP